MEQTERTETAETVEQPCEDGEAAETGCEQDADELTALRDRVRELEEQIATRECETARAQRECEEFERYFPEVALRTVPEEVWARVRTGVPLSAAYALYDVRVRREREARAREEERAAAMSVGIPDEAGRDYFSPAQVRAMSPREVRENYDRIFESMRHWQ